MDPIALESSSRLSQSLLWDYEAAYFNEQGINAWAGTVPFFSTSNPFIADCYAQVIIGYIRDLIRSNAINLNTTFYIIELGTGSGQFAFYCAKRLADLKEQLGLKIDLCYVMTDFVEENLLFWQNQHALQPSFESDLLDVAYYNLHEPSSIKLIHRECLLDTSSKTNPLVVIANYVFDSTPQDAFKIDNHHLAESLITLSTPEDNLTINQFPKSLSRLDYTFNYNALTDRNYYQQSIWNDVLEFYQHNLQQGNFTLPTTIFNALDHLNQLCDNQMLFLASDKAYTDLADITNRIDLKISFHGNAFSLAANFHTVELYFNFQNGVTFHHPPGNLIITSAFVLGQSQQQLCDTSLAIRNKLCQFGPSDYLRLHYYLQDNHIDLSILLAKMRMSHWDPYILSLHAAKISEALSNTTEELRQAFLIGLEKTEKMIYPMPAMRDHYFVIAMIYHNFQCYEKAISFYQQSLELAASRNKQILFTYLNLAICCYKVNRLGEAENAIELAYQHAPDDEMVNEWRIIIKNGMSS